MQSSVDHESGNGEAPPNPDILDILAEQGEHASDMNSARLTATSDSPNIQQQPSQYSVPLEALCWGSSGLPLSPAEPERFVLETLDQTERMR